MAEFTTSDGVRLHYETAGREDGPPLVFSNSLGTDLSLWDGQLDDATGLGLRVIRYDQRGHGGSSAPEGDYKIERLGQDVLELLDALDLQKASYCGVSMGALTGVWLAMHHSRRLDRVAICNTAVWNPPREAWDERIAKVRKDGTAAVAEGTLERWFTPEFRADNPEAVERIRAMILATNPVGYAGCASAVRDADLRDMLGLVEAPVMVVVGSRDTAAPPERGQYIVEHVPGAQKLVLECAHISNVEKRAEFNAAVLGFLAGGSA